MYYTMGVGFGYGMGLIFGLASLCGTIAFATSGLFIQAIVWGVVLAVLAFIFVRMEWKANKS